MSTQLSPDELWDSAVPTGRTFDPATLAGLPDAARRYLRHAIAPGTPLAGAVRIRMRGRIRLRGWLPFTGEEVVVWDRGLIWTATVRMFGLPISGSDRYVDGGGSQRWKLLGLIPVMSASGPDITRSTIGRVAAEAVWMPSVLAGDNVSWNEIDASRAQARFTYAGEEIAYTLEIEESGRLRSISLKRWGDPDKGGFRYETFGGIVEEEETFDGYTIPTRLRLGWFFGTDRFEPEGEFFRCTVDGVEWR